jgi:hypothetical protein
LIGDDLSGEETMRLSRREFLANGLSAMGSGLPVLGCPSPALANSVGGCLISHDGFAKVRSSATAFGNTRVSLFDRSKHIRTTGDPALDRALDASIKRLADLFGQIPAFGFYREDDHPDISAMNAFATPERTDIPGTWGTIGFGTTLFQREMGKHDRYGGTIVAIIAHEFGHIWAMQAGIIDKINAGQKTVKRSELHADFLAGYFLGTRKRAAPNLSLQSAGDLFNRLGDHNTESPSHHGTPGERVAAAEEGFKVSYLQNRDARHAFAAGLEYVSRL